MIIGLVPIDDWPVLTGLNRLLCELWPLGLWRDLNALKSRAGGNYKNRQFSKKKSIPFHFPRRWRVGSPRGRYGTTRDHLAACQLESRRRRRRRRIVRIRRRIRRSTGAIIVRVRMVSGVRCGKVVMMVVMVSCCRGGRSVMMRRRGGIRRHRRTAGPSCSGAAGIHSGAGTISHVMDVVVWCVMV